ncbi:heme biosynthesis HemY N-terminal domain-containing protein [Alsobacter sp. R-9]
MIRVLVFIALLVGLAFGAAWLVDRPGEVVMTFEGYRIETSVLAAVGLVAALAAFIIILWALIRAILRLPSAIGFASRARKRARGFAAVSRGMIAVGAGDPRSAKRNADDAGKLLGNEPLVLLLQAQAAQMAGDRPAAEGAFKRMLEEPETRVLGLRGLFVEARRKGDAAAARAYAAEASRLAPTVSWAGEALLEYQCADEDWTGALATLDRGAKGLDKPVYRRQRAVLLTADAMTRAEREPDTALQKVQEAVKLAPALVPAVALMSRLLARRGDLRKASRVVETAWSQSPHPDLADAYLAVRIGDSVRDRLTRAEKLLSLTPRDPEARLAVAQAALAARQFDKARKVVGPLLEEGRPPVRVCLLMADLEEAEHEHGGAVREWLARASRAPRDPAWIADGVIADRWAPISPVTGRLDAFVWGTPVEQITAAHPERVYRPPAARLPVPPTDTVLVDVDEPEAAAPPEPAPQPAAANGAAASAPAAALAARETVTTASAAEPGAEPAPAATTAPVVEVMPPPGPADDGRGGSARRGGPGQPSPVVFPLTTPPDDPGTELGERPQRGRTYLQ